MSPAIPQEPRPLIERLRERCPKLGWSIEDGSVRGRGPDGYGDVGFLNTSDRRWIQCWNRKQGIRHKDAVNCNRDRPYTDDEVLELVGAWYDKTYPQPADKPAEPHEAFARFVHAMCELEPELTVKWISLTECRLMYRDFLEPSIYIAKVFDATALPIVGELVRAIRDRYLSAHGPLAMQKAITADATNRLAGGEHAFRVGNVTGIFDPKVGWIVNGEKTSFALARDLLTYPEPFARFLEEVRRHEERTGIKASNIRHYRRGERSREGFVADLGGKAEIRVYYDPIADEWAVTSLGKSGALVKRSPYDAYILASTMILNAQAESKVATNEVTVPIKVDISEEETSRVERMADAMVTAASAAEALNTEKERAMTLENREHIVRLNRAKQLNNAALAMEQVYRIWMSKYRGEVSPRGEDLPGTHAALKISGYSADGSLVSYGVGSVGFLDGRYQYLGSPFDGTAEQFCEYAYTQMKPELDKYIAQINAKTTKEQKTMGKPTMAEKIEAAAYLVAAEKVTKTGQTVLVNALMRHIGSDDEGTRTKIAAFFASDIGAAFVAGSVGFAIQSAPHNDERLARLADTMQMAGMAKGMGAVADLVLDPMLEAMGDAIKGLPEPAEKVRAAPEEHHEQEHEHEVAAKGGKRARA